MSVAKPAYTHSIVTVNAGSVIPEALMLKLCTEYPSCVGLVVREPDKLEVERFFDLGDVEARLKMLSSINVNTKKFLRQFTFCAAPAEFDEDDCQPWIAIRDSKNKPLLTVSMEGDFPGRTGKEGESESFVVMNEYLGPKLEDFYKLSGNNPQKLFEFLSSVSFTNDLKNVYGFRAGICFMPTIGDPVLLGNFREEGKGGSDYTWGSCTFNHGYTEAVVETATPAPKEATMPKNPPKVSKYADAEPVDPTVQPAPSVPQVPLTDPGDKVAKDLTDDGYVDWKPPQGLHGKPLKKAYRDMNNGELPENWQQRPALRIRAKTDADVAKVVQGPKAVVKDMKQEAPKIVLPVIDGSQQAKAVDFIKKHLGDGSVVIDDNPLETQKQESTFARFSEMCLRTGSLDEINRWPVSGIFAFTKQNSEVAALLLIELRRDRINRMATMKDGQKTMGELTGTEPGKTVETQPAQPLETKPLPTEVPAVPEPRRASGGSKYA